MNPADKERTIAAYNTQAGVFSKKFSAMSETRAVFLDRFLEILPGPEVLDIGAGDGSAALYLRERGCSVVPVDLSHAMVTIMHERGLDPKLMDMERMDFSDEAFHGVLALSSLMNIPKANLVSVIANVARMLKPGGVFASFITKGEGERMETDERHPGTERWFSYYSFEELERLLDPCFEILAMENAPTPARQWIFTLCRKR